MSDKVKIVIEIDDASTILKASGFESYSDENLHEEIIAAMTDILYCPPVVISVKQKMEDGIICCFCNKPIKRIEIALETVAKRPSGDYCHISCFKKAKAKKEEE
ncbi:MAG: hypothetical protein ACTSYA_01685 [Candidatus Kariarchaeaceae archaeon]